MFLPMPPTGSPVVTERCPDAVRCADAFHVIKWASSALDEVRRQAWNEARRAGAWRGQGARATRCHRRRPGLQTLRYALWKNPDNLTDRQRDKLDWIAKTDPRLHRAYLLKEGLRYVFAVKGEPGKQALDRWISWARRCRIPAFVVLQRRIVKHRAAIDAALENNLSNALIESTNTKIRLITRVAFGFHSAAPLIALAMLSLGGHRPTLPRTPMTHGYVRRRRNRTTQRERKPPNGRGGSAGVDRDRRTEHRQLGVVGQRPLDHGQRDRAELVVVHGRAEEADGPAAGQLDRRARGGQHVRLAAGQVQQHQPARRRPRLWTRATVSWPR